MNNWQKFGLGILIIATVAYIKFAFFTASAPLSEEPQQPQAEEQQQKAEEPKEKVYVTVYFIAQNENKEEVYKAVKREYDREKDDSKIKFAIYNLIKGPSAWEKSKGVYTEIPSGTKILAINEDADKVVIDLNGEFENGGGTDSIYKRLFQLIKTADKNSKRPVYLYINGKQADVIGGEGIMITQPLGEGSLNG